MAAVPVGYEPYGKPLGSQRYLTPAPRWLVTLVPE